MTGAPKSLQQPLKPMDTPVVERAFELAASGEFTRLREIGWRLEREGYLDAQEHLQISRHLRRQLRLVVRRASGLEPSRTHGENPAAACDRDHSDLHPDMRGQRVG